MFKRHFHLPFFVLLLAAGFLAACGRVDGDILYIGGIPDQDMSVLEGRFSLLAEYLGDETGLDIRYLPSIDYAAVVTGFRNGDIQLAWYGGLTGVQARLAVPGSQVLAQRPRDEQFRSVFVTGRHSGITTPADLRGRTLAFGSESSTSGYMMPLHFLLEVGLDPEQDLRRTGFSGSHDTTWKLVETGAFDAGVLSAALWEARVLEGKVNLDRVDIFWTTPAYADYHWVVRDDLDFVYGDGTMERLRDALLGLDAANGGRQAKIMQAFQDERFIPSVAENYEAIENIARSLGIIER